MTWAGHEQPAPCEINVKVLQTAERAALVTPAFRKGAAVWLPLSLIELAANEDIAGTYRLTCPEWLAKKRGLL